MLQERATIHSDYPFLWTKLEFSPGVADSVFNFGSFASTRFELQVVDIGVVVYVKSDRFNVFWNLHFGSDVLGL